MDGNHLRCDPFPLTAEAGFRFPHGSWLDTKSAILRALATEVSMVSLDGGPGCGKTCLLEDLLESVPGRRTCVSRIVSGQLDADEALWMVAIDLELPVGAEADVRRVLSGALASRALDGDRLLVAVDEAQGLTPSAVAALEWLCSQSRRAGQVPVQVLLAGTGLPAELRAPAGSCLRRGFRLAPLEAADVLPYVTARLLRCGWRGRPALDPELGMALHRASGGVPRTLNLLARRLLLHAAVEHRERLEAADVARVGHELHEELGLALPAAS